MGNKLPVNWSFAGISLLFIVLAGSILYFAQNVSQNRQITSSQAAVIANDCVNGIQTVTILKDGQPLNDGAVVNDLNNLSCKIHVQGVVRADTALVCAFQVGNQNWVIGCPNSPGDFVQEAPPGKSLTGDDVTTTFTKCSQGLLNPPAGYHSPATGEAIQARAIRRVGSCTVDEPPIPWEQQGYYAAGTNFSLQTTVPTQNPTAQPTNQPTVQPTTQPTNQPSTTPQASQTSLYVSPNPATAGSQITVTATGTTSCSTFISDPPGTNGFTNCAQSGGFSCSGNPQNDGKPCWWRWTCSASNTAGNYTATFTANNDSSCTSTASFTVNPVSCPRGNMGNLNCDSQGCINNEDLTIFRTYFGKPGVVGNFFNDVSTIIDTGDFEILRQYFGTCSVN